MILETLRDPQRLLASLREVACEIMTLCRMDKRRKLKSTAETLRAIVIWDEEVDKKKTILSTFHLSTFHFPLFQLTIYP
jgi:hypothetical protein